MWAKSFLTISSSWVFTQSVVGPELPPASFSSNVYGSTMVSLTGGDPVNSTVRWLTRSRKIVELNARHAMNESGLYLIGDISGFNRSAGSSGWSGRNRGYSEVSFGNDD
jgi:hypothetical protein